MPIADIPILSMLRTRLEWAQARQRVLAENVANADTPSYQARDLSPLTFNEPSSIASSAVSSVALARTDGAHIAGLDGESQFRSEKGNFHYEIRPAGNAVSLEEEMMKVAANQMDYQTVASLYTSSLGLIKTAIGKG
jgi:flagellar basal-body rod protein FlgB